MKQRNDEKKKVTVLRNEWEPVREKKQEVVWCKKENEEMGKGVRKTPSNKEIKRGKLKLRKELQGVNGWMSEREKNEKMAKE